jgi:hypothetical protein
LDWGGGGVGPSQSLHCTTQQRKKRAHTMWYSNPWSRCSNLRPRGQCSDDTKTPIVSSSIIFIIRLIGRKNVITFLRRESFKSYQLSLCAFIVIGKLRLDMASASRTQLQRPTYAHNAFSTSAHTRSCILQRYTSA